VKRLLLLAWWPAWVVDSRQLDHANVWVGHRSQQVEHNLNGLPCTDSARIAISMTLPKCFLSQTYVLVIQRPSTEPTGRYHEVVPHVHVAALTISNAPN
jgi:hypothetical protein